MKTMLNKKSIIELQILSDYNTRFKNLFYLFIFLNNVYFYHVNQIFILNRDKQQLLHLKKIQITKNKFTIIFSNLMNLILIWYKGRERV